MKRLIRLAAFVLLAAGLAVANQLYVVHQVRLALVAGFVAGWTLEQQDNARRLKAGHSCGDA